MTRNLADDNFIIRIRVNPKPPITTKVSNANSLDPDEMQSNSASHLDPSYLTLQTFSPTLSDIAARWKLKQTRNSAGEILFGRQRVNTVLDQLPPWKVGNGSGTSLFVYLLKLTFKFCYKKIIFCQYSLISLINPFSAGTTFMLMQTGWIQASRRVTRRLAWDPTCLPLSLSFPIKNKRKLQVLKKQTTI